MNQNQIVKNQIFNVGYENLKIIDIANKVKSTVSKNFPELKNIKIITTSDDKRSYHIHSGKIKKVLGFKPKRSIEDAIDELCYAFKNNFIKKPYDNDIYFNVERLRKNMPKNKSVIVTGGAGFIGSHMVDLLLNNNNKVYVIDNFSGGHEKNLSHHKNNKNLIIENADIKNLEKLKIFLNTVQSVYHFARIGDIVPSIDNPILYFKNNVQGTVNLLKILFR